MYTYVKVVDAPRPANAHIFNSHKRNMKDSFAHHNTKMLIRMREMVKNRKTKTQVPCHGRSSSQLRHVPSI